MRFTEVILYSFCSLEYKSLVVPENYFLKYFNKQYSPKIKLGAVVANSFVEKEFNEKSNGDVILFILGIWKELHTKSDATFLGFREMEITNCLYREVTISKYEPMKKAEKKSEALPKKVEKKSEVPQEKTVEEKPKKEYIAQCGFGSSSSDSTSRYPGSHFTKIPASATSSFDFRSKGRERQVESSSDSKINFGYFQCSSYKPYNVTSSPDFCAEVKSLSSRPDPSYYDFFGKNREHEEFKKKIKRTEVLEKFKALNLHVERSMKSGDRQFRDFQDILYILTSYKQTFEPDIRTKIKEKINFNKEEKNTVNLVFRSLKHMGDFGNDEIGAINEISINVLNKYFEFAHENVVAMRFTEVILYSFCSLECRSLVVPENYYFLKYFNKRYSPEIQLGAVVVNSFLGKGFIKRSHVDIILFVLDVWKGVTTKSAMTNSNATFLGFREKEITNCLYREIAKLTRFIRKCQKSIYTILCQLLEGINHLDSSQIFQLPLTIINLFISTYKSKIFRWKFNPSKFQEEDKLVLNCFYVSINILSKCCQASADIPFDEMILLKTFEEFSPFISSNFISQEICESLLYCICNVVDKRNIRDKGYFNIKIFEEFFLDPKVSTEIKLASSFILSYLYSIEEKGIKSNILEYMESILTYPVMKLNQSYCGFKEKEIENCIGLLSRQQPELKKKTPLK